MREMREKAPLSPLFVSFATDDTRDQVRFIGGKLEGIKHILIIN